MRKFPAAAQQARAILPTIFRALVRARRAILTIALMYGVSVIAGMIIIGVIGLMLDGAMRLLERLKFVRWRYVR